MRVITNREMEVFVLRRYGEMTFKEIAEKYDLTPSRIQAIHKKASRIAYNAIRRIQPLSFNCDQLEGVKWYYDDNGKRIKPTPYPKGQALLWFSFALTSEKIKNSLITLVSLIDSPLLSKK